MTFDEMPKAMEVLLAEVKALRAEVSTLRGQAANEAPDEDGDLTVRQAAKRLNVSTDTIRKWVRLGKLKSSRPGGPRGRHRFSPEDLEAFKRGGDVAELTAAQEVAAVVRRIRGG